MTSDKLNHTVIRYIDIIKRYGRGRRARTILDKASVELRAGECTLLSGKNGSGKSTLLRIMAGLLRPTSARINTGLESRSWEKHRPTIRRQVMYLYQEPYMFDGTVYHNLRHAQAGKNNPEIIQQALQWADLVEHTDTQARCLSGGEKQRVALAQAWLKQPSILLLDEPTANMDDQARLRTDKLLCNLKNRGTALLIASHDHYHFNQTMDKRLLLQQGKIIDLDADKNSNIGENIVPFPNQQADSLGPHD